MLNKITLILLSVSFSTIAWAAQCPQPSEWSHVKGQEWELSVKAKQEGWQAMAKPGAKESDLTSLPPDKPLLIGIFATERRFTTCGYSLGGRDQSIAAVDIDHAVDFKKLKPPFYRKKEHYFCQTVSGTPEVCEWEWKIK